MAAPILVTGATGRIGAVGRTVTETAVEARRSRACDGAN
jgi:hypothetical protein